MNLEKFYSHIYRLAYITRYSNRVRIRNEDVAQHSFFVSAIVIYLYEKYNFKLDVALTMAICHDIPEADISDMSNALKVKYPELSNQLSIVEHKERLSRFGVDYISASLSSSNRKLIIMNQKECNDDLVQDMIDVLTSFCARLYGRRSARNKARQAIKIIQEDKNENQ